MPDMPHNGKLYSPDELALLAESLRLAEAEQLDARRQVELGQFFTPNPTAELMASLFGPPPEHVRLLDAGAGVGVLSAAFVAGCCKQPHPPKSIAVTAYELDESLLASLARMLSACSDLCAGYGIAFSYEVVHADFIAAGTKQIAEALISPNRPTYNRAVLNPPYGKLGSSSQHRRLLRSIGVEAGNQYTAFLAVVAGLLAPHAELVAITPRSFCNGPYFKQFRNVFLDTVAIRHIHVYAARDSAFRDDEVLQENVILRVEKRGEPGLVTITANDGPNDPLLSERVVDYSQVVHPDDPERFIRIAADELDQRVLERMALFSSSLVDLGLEVSTGRVVDFRAAHYLRPDPTGDTVPLIYPLHFDRGRLR